MNAEQRQTAANPWTKPTDLSHWPAFRQLWNYTCTIAIIITQSGRWYSFYHPTEGRRLSRPRWLVIYPDGLPAREQSPIQVITGAVSISFVDQANALTITLRRLPRNVLWQWGIKGAICIHERDSKCKIHVPLFGYWGLWSPDPPGLCPWNPLIPQTLSTLPPRSLCLPATQLPGVEQAIGQGGRMPPSQMLMQWGKTRPLTPHFPMASLSIVRLKFGDQRICLLVNTVPTDILTTDIY